VTSVVIKWMQLQLQNEGQTLLMQEECIKELYQCIDELTEKE
jgi:hypothetical protein